MKNETTILLKTKHYKNKTTKQNYSVKMILNLSHKLKVHNKLETQVSNL